MTVKVVSRSSDNGQSQLHHIDGGRYDSKKKCWIFPLEYYDQLVELRNRQHGQIALKPVQINSSALKSMEVYLLDVGYSPSTIRNYRRHLASFLKYAVGNTDDET